MIKNRLHEKITSCKTVACKELIIDNNVKRKKIRTNVYVYVDNKIVRKGLKNDVFRDIILLKIA